MQFSYSMPSTNMMDYTMFDNPEKTIIQSWQINAAAWSDAIAHDRIASRTLVTNRAVMDAVLALNPSTAIDIGCGEGWLTRTLNAAGIDSLGVDGNAELIAIARKLAARHPGHQHYETINYLDIANGCLNKHFELAVCNFSLLGKESVENLLRAMPALLEPGGHLIIQTLHPRSACGDQPYKDGWREGSWEGFGDGFSSPAPWYFRTLESWQNLLQDCGFSVETVGEPAHPETGVPMSVIFVAKVG